MASFDFEPQKKKKAPAALGQPRDMGASILLALSLSLSLSRSQIRGCPTAAHRSVGDYKERSRGCNLAETTASAPTRAMLRQVPRPPSARLTLVTQAARVAGRHPDRLKVGTRRRPNAPPEPSQLPPRGLELGYPQNTKTFPKISKMDPYTLKCFRTQNPKAS